jgi:hypothetical protein
MSGSLAEEELLTMRTEADEGDEEEASNRERAPVTQGRQRRPTNWSTQNPVARPMSFQERAVR